MLNKNKKKVIFFFLKLAHQKNKTHVGTAGHLSMLSERRVYEIIMQF